MSIDKLDYSTEVIEALQGAYRQDWCLTNWTGTGKPLLPAGMIISILGYPYIVSGGDETPTDPASDGAVYLKITPDAPAGATATAEYVNTFSGTWNEAYNGFYDGDSLFLNVFMTKATTNWTAKGTWLNFRERKLALISDGLTVEGNLTVGGDVEISGEFINKIKATNGYEEKLLLSGDFIRNDVYNVLSPYIPSINDSIKIGGTLYFAVTSKTYICHSAVRISSTAIHLKCVIVGVGYILFEMNTNTGGSGLNGMITL